MPSRNVVKNDVSSTFYHVYARGHGKMDIYRDNEDYRVFLNLLKRYLGTEAQKDSCGRTYNNLKGKVDLICYCLMKNHFHLLIYQFESGSMTKLMHGVITCYSRYFNKKYSLSGALFETTYKASIIGTDEYFLHISRYIHLNPVNWREYEYSSIGYYSDKRSSDWISTHWVDAMFSSSKEYFAFISDYEGCKSSLDEIKSGLVDG